MTSQSLCTYLWILLDTSFKFKVWYTAVIEGRDPPQRRTKKPKRMSFAFQSGEGGEMAADAGKLPSCKKRRMAVGAAVLGNPSCMLDGEAASASGSDESNGPRAEEQALSSSSLASLLSFSSSSSDSDKDSDKKSGGDGPRGWSRWWSCQFFGQC